MLNKDLLPIFMMVYHQTFISIFSTIIGFIYLIPLNFFGFNIYTITSQNTQRVILSKIIWSSQLDENNNPVGYLLGDSYIGYYDHENKILKCISNKCNYTKITMKPNTITNTNKDVKEEYIKIYFKNNYTNYVMYTHRNFNVSRFITQPKQEKVIDQIIEQYNKSINNSHVCILFGRPNTGKSMVSLLLAKKLKSYYCKSYKPTDPGDSIDLLYSIVNPNSNTPLVILLDEFDIILDKIHNKKTEKNKLPVLTEVTDKTSWNQLFDNISIGFYPFTIFILTTNLNPVDINHLYDSSYIREKRCDLILEM